jgi:hypothetical protein
MGSTRALAQGHIERPCLGENASFSILQSTHFVFKIKMTPLLKDYQIIATEKRLQRSNNVAL